MIFHMSDFNIPAELVITKNGELIDVVKLDKEECTFGRLPEMNDFSVNSDIVSSQHGIFVFMWDTFAYIDLASSNGTYINGQRIFSQDGSPTKPILLYDSDILTIGEIGDPERVSIIFSSVTFANKEWRVVPMRIGDKITIGRSNDNVICIQDIRVSRKHAYITVQSSGLTVTDNRSYNGTILNGVSIEGTQRFKTGSVLQIGDTKIVRIDSVLFYQATVTNYTYNNIPDDKKDLSEYEVPEETNLPKDGVQVRISHISKTVPCKKTDGNNSGSRKILNDISLVVNPGELVAILGGSGSGKTTLMNCINGFEPATEGSVMINGTDLYKSYQTLKTYIGYVPQQDIVFDNLTVKNMLKYSCKLRLPDDVTKAEIEDRVNEVMDMVGLTEQKDTYIRKLSGGQRKRASIAVELVSGPPLFFLDEPTSGLDPEAETNLMKQLKKLSKQKGKTIIVVTHTLQNIHMFDKIIFIAPGGYLCYYGTPDNAKTFFEVDNISDAYEKISENISMYVNRYNTLVKEGVL